VEPAPDISQAMWRYFEAQGMADPYAAVRKATEDLIADAETRAKRRLRNLRESIPDQQEITDLRVAGELLLTYQGEIARGAQEANLRDYTGEPIDIDLDPEMTAVENAQAYFRRYEKAQRAARRIPALIGELETEFVYLEQLAVDLELAESRPEIDTVRDMLASTGLAPSGRRKSASQVSEPRRFELDGFPVYVGRNARQNEQVTFRRAAPQDLWLHVRGLPGAHVVIKRGRQVIPEQVIQRAARLAAYYSRARGSERQVAVDVTERRFVRRVGGKYPGMVTYQNEETLWVRDFDSVA
jgi:predicted ribosome quality control (RQC) complex YloA/Tae2 family protein